MAVKALPQPHVCGPGTAASAGWEPRVAHLSRTVHNALRVRMGHGPKSASERLEQGALASEGDLPLTTRKEGAVALTWASFSEARGEDGLAHVLKQGDTDALCGVRVLAGDIRGRRRCPECRSLQRGALRQSSSGWVPK